MMTTESFIGNLASVLKIENLSEDIVNNLRREQITAENFTLLDDGDLRDLGFAMGHRKMLLVWIAHQKANEAVTMEPQAVLTPLTPASHVSFNNSSTASPVVDPSTCGVRNKENFTSFKAFRVDELISKCKTATFDGAHLVEQLKNGILYSRNERIFFVKTISKYLMYNCAKQNYPSSAEKSEMGHSIIDTFPVLKSALTGGFEDFYDPIHQTGYMEMFIRTKRSRSLGIETRWTNRSVRTLDTTDAESDEVRLLRERRPTVTNRAELLQSMGNTRGDRRTWIQNKHSSITEILRKYPRFQDIDETITEEFRAMFPGSKSLMSEWPNYKTKILNLARTRTPSVVNEATDDADDDKLSEVAFKCLVVLLPSPPKRGVKMPRLAPEASIDQFYVTFENETVDEALVRLRDRCILQPCLFTAQQHFFLKVDNTAIPLLSASCFTEAVEQVFMAFWVFNVEYPNSLRVFYEFVGHMMAFDKFKVGPTIRSLLHELQKLATAQPS